MEFTGGIHFGDSYYNAVNATWPFARLEIEPGMIRLKTTFFDSFAFQKSEITRLSKYRGFFSTGLRIEQSKSGCVPFVVFWTFNFPSVKAKLRECGYAMEDSST